MQVSLCYTVKLYIYTYILLVLKHTRGMSYPIIRELTASEVYPRHDSRIGVQNRVPSLLSPALRYIMNTMVIGHPALFIMKPSFLLQVLLFMCNPVASCTGQQSRKHVNSHKN